MDAQYKVKGYHFYILYFLCVCCFFEVVLMGVKFIIMMGVVCTQQQHGVAEKEKKTFPFGRKPIFCFFVFCFFPIFFSRVVVCNFLIMRDRDSHHHQRRRIKR